MCGRAPPHMPPCACACATKRCETRNNAETPKSTPPLVGDNRAETERTLNLLVVVQAMTLDELILEISERAYRRYQSLACADDVATEAQMDALRWREQGNKRVADAVSSAGIRAIGWHDAIAHLKNIRE